MTIKKKMMCFIVVFALINFAVFTTISIVTTFSRSEARITSYKERLLLERKEQISNYVHLAINAIQTLPRDEATKAIKNIKYGQNGYFWIQDFGNFMISHPDARLEGKDMSGLKDPNGILILQEISKVCKEKGEGYVSYSWKAPGDEKMQPKLSFARTIPKWNWIVGTGIYVEDINLLVAKEREKMKGEIAATIYQSLAVAVALSVIMSLIAIFVVNRFMVHPILTISQAMKNFNNNLTTQVPVSTNDEVGELTTWFNDHIGNLRQVIARFSEVSQKINSFAGSMSTNVTQQVDFALQLSSSVAEISSTMEEFSSTAVQIANHSRDVVDIAARTLEQTKEGATGVETITMKMNEINSDSEVNIREIVDLGRKSKEITKIMEIINNIANQTKLIAFNAALEAASAGESGKRFGVVAVEIRRLADSVVESTGEIEGKITEIMEAVNRLVIASEKSSKSIQQGLDYSCQSATMLIDVVDGAENTTDAAKQISLSTQQQQTASSQVVIALREIQEGARLASESIQQTKVISGDLAELSDNLKALVDKFTL